MRAHTPYNPQVCARLGASRTYYKLSSNSHNFGRICPIANYNMIRDYHADAASAVIALIVLILLMIRQTFPIYSPICLPMVSAMIVSMVNAMIVSMVNATIV